MKKSPVKRRSGHIARPFEQIVIESVTPSIDGGRHPIKGIVGDVLLVQANVFRHGHERVRAMVRWSSPGDATARDTAMTLVNAGLDLWSAALPMERQGRYRFAIIAWTDVYASWVDELTKRVAARQADVHSEIEEGISLVRRTFDRVRRDEKRRVGTLLDLLHDSARDPALLLAVASSDASLDLMASVMPRDDEARSEPELEVWVDRERAQVGAWYELFVRSQGTQPGVSGTFRDAERRLPEIRRLGFDVVYLAPIHPIGHTGRKGRDNTLDAAPGDPGSPWAIGSQDGGHTAIEPSLGTLEDFDRFVRAADDLGMELALDFAVQCSPDHPWVREHPDWFYRRPDGTIRYAENPPKKYQDIYPINFETEDWRNLWDALADVVRFWVGHNVRIFRVDNPHTKPLGFWTWLIDSIHRDHPDVIFLAEAFTRPPMMQALAKRGFTQSYTYFTWRNTKPEIIEYLTELTRTEMAQYFRPNFFANTPDILPPILQHGGRPAFKSRLTLAATLSPSYGIYSGFELCEHAAVEGREEYLHSEKYQLSVRDWNAPGNINDFITRINCARRENPALRQFVNLQFLDVDDDQLLAYAKWTTDGSNVVLVVVNLDPYAAHSAMVAVPLGLVGVAAGGTYGVHDVLTGDRYTWSDRNFVRLNPSAGEPAHILRVEKG
jgi:starch synthase (maltosyl-transferring)